MMKGTQWDFNWTPQLGKDIDEIMPCGWTWLVPDGDDEYEYKEVQRVLEFWNAIRIVDTEWAIGSRSGSVRT